MRQYFLILTLIVLVVPQTQTVFAATAITGTITAKRGDSVKVEFQPHETAGPAVGDKVEFSTELKGMKGIKVNAGTGKVTKVDGNAVWVKITKNRPNLKMTAIIQATGKPGAIEYILDMDELRWQVKSKWYQSPGAKLKVKLPGGLEFKTYTSRSYSSQNPYTSITIESEAQGSPLKEHHRQHRKTVYRNGKTNKCKIVWKDREINGISAFCIASRAQCTESMYGPIVNYFNFYASCRAKDFPRKADLIEGYYSLSFSDRFVNGGGSASDQVEKVFLDALRSLSIEIKK